MPVRSSELGGKPGGLQPGEAVATGPEGLDIGFPLFQNPVQ